MPVDKPAAKTAPKAASQAARQATRQAARPAAEPATAPGRPAGVTAPAPRRPAKRAATAGRGTAAPAELADRFDFQSNSLGYALRRAQVRAYDLFFETLGELDLSPARLTALSIIAMESDINQATLARRLNVAGPSVLKVIDALEGAGFIRRADVAGDRRRYSLVLTAPGRAMLDTLRQRLAAYEARLAQQLSEAERGQLMDLLERVAR